MHTDRCGNTCRQKCHAKGKVREAKIQEFMSRDTMNVELEMCDYTGNNWSHQNSKKRFKEKFGNHTRKTFNRFTAKEASHIIQKVLLFYNCRKNPPELFYELILSTRLCLPYKLP